MKKTKIILTACLLALGFAAANARADIALTPTTGPYYVGFVDAFTPMPANPTAEAALINTLILVPAGSKQLLAPPTELTAYDRTLSDLSGPFPTADPIGVANVNTYSNIVVTGYAYILGQYDGPNVGDFVWYVPSGTYAIPDRLPNPVRVGGAKGLSHSAVYEVDPVPDSGMNLMLLGGALVGLEGLRRRFRA